MSVYQAPQPRHIAVLLYHEHTNTPTHKRKGDLLTYQSSREDHGTRNGNLAHFHLVGLEYYSRVLRLHKSHDLAGGLGEVAS